MKKLFLAVFLSFSVFYINAQTADEIIGKFVEANGGLEKLSSIHSLQVESTMNIEQMGSTITIVTLKEKNKLFRIQSSSPMSNEESFTVITDTAGYTFIPAMNSPMGSMDASLTKFNNEEFIASAYQKDCEGLFAPLVNYVSKGHTATYEGSEKVNGVECDKINLKLKTGQEMIFFISKTNSQVRRLQVAAPIALDMMGMSAMRRAFGGGERSNKMASRKIDIDYEKYKLFNGIPLPTKQTVQLGMMQMQLDNISFKINEPINARWYMVK